MNTILIVAILGLVVVVAVIALWMIRRKKAKSDSNEPHKVGAVKRYTR